jgi:hypothetical protein
VLQHYNNNPSKVVTYFYFNFNNIQKQNPKLMLHSLIYQLSQQCIKIPASLNTLFSSCNSGQQQPSLHALVEVMQQIIQDFPHVYIVLNALDKCSKRTELTDILKTIAAWRLKNLHILITSHKEQDIKSSLETIIDQQNIICLQSKLVDRDIQKYIQQRLSNNKKLGKWGEDLRQEIEAALIKGAHRIYGFLSYYSLETQG